MSQGKLFPIHHSIVSISSCQTESETQTIMAHTHNIDEGSSNIIIICRHPLLGLHYMYKSYLG